MIHSRSFQILLVLTLTGANHARSFAQTPPDAPAAGFAESTAFLRSADGAFTLLPNGRLQSDFYAYSSGNDHPKAGFITKRARLELAGWVGSWVYFSIAGDFAAGGPAGANPVPQTNVNATDDYVAIAPWGDLAVLQVGQFDAPFTLENRTSDKYFDFMERSLTVRSFGIPSNKEVGAMVHGLPTNKAFYYSLAVINGDGQNFRNVDNQFDVMGRAWVAPMALSGIEILSRVTVGGSGWTGRRENGLALSTQSTAGGFSFFRPAWKATLPLELHQQGSLRAWALEVNAPFGHRFGARWEFISKRQKFAVNDVTKADKPVTFGGLGVLDGWATYGEVWFWALGDDRIIGEPGLQMPTRLKSFGVHAPEHGLMLALRAEDLSETATENASTLPLAQPSPSEGTTKIRQLSLGANYWFSKRFRASVNYGWLHMAGTASTVKTMSDHNEQEWSMRLAVAL